MIYKVNYQETKHQAPLRESTKSLYIEASSIRDVREKLAKHTPYTIEYIEKLGQAHLEYEQETNPDFEVLSF